MTLSSGGGEFVFVTMPAFNAARDIRQRLGPVPAQTHRSIEAIVVDDGSTDDTPRIVEAVAASDPRAELVRLANAGAGRSRDAFMATIDADDLWHPIKIAKPLARMHEAGRSFLDCSPVSQDTPDAGGGGPSVRAHLHDRPEPSRHA